jgi:hypothetical protein
MRNFPLGALFGLTLLIQPLIAEERTPEVDAVGIFGEFTLVGGERIIGLYHPEKGVIEVYAAGKAREVTARDIVSRRRLAPEAEVEPTNLETGQARQHTLALMIEHAQVDRVHLENQHSELEKTRQSWELELSKREEGNKTATEALEQEQNRERKAAYAGMSTEHLKAIAAAHVAIAEADVAIAAVDARMAAVRAHLEDLQSRSDWLIGRLRTMNAAAGEK